MIALIDSREAPLDCTVRCGIRALLALALPEQAAEESASRVRSTRNRLTAEEYDQKRAELKVIRDLPEYRGWGGQNKLAKHLGVSVNWITQNIGRY